MKKLKFMLAAATALGLATASQAYNGSVNFEGANPLTDGYFQFTGTEGDNESELVEETYTPQHLVRLWSNSTHNRHLKVSTGTDPLLRKIESSAIDIPSGGIYIDTLVQFTVTPASDTVTASATDKLMIYLKESVVNAELGTTETNLVVKAALRSAEEGEFGEEGSETFTPTEVEVSSAVVPGQWYRLTVKSYVVDTDLLLFNIWLDGAPLTTGSTALYGDDTSVFPSLLGRTNAQIAAVGFAGEGAVDDIAFTTDDPFVAALDFTLTLGQNVSSVAFTIDGQDYTAAATATYAVYPGSTITLGQIAYAEGYMADTAPVTTGLTLADGTYTVGEDAATLALSAVQFVAKVGDTPYANLADALAGATAGQTVKLFQNATGAQEISTAAATLDLNGKTLTGTTKITFTGNEAKTLKGGEIAGVYNVFTNVAPANQNLTIDGMTFHASVLPQGSGELLFITNSTFLCDLTTAGAAVTEGSTIHSYGVMLLSGNVHLVNFSQVDIVDNWFAQARRAAVEAATTNDLYFYGNTVDASVNTVASSDGLAARYPALQIFSNGRVFIENNTFTGQYLGEAFCMYAKTTYRFTDKAIVFNGNTVSDGVLHLWGVYDVDASGSAAIADANVYFGANTIGENVDLTKCVYKTTEDDAPFGPTPATLALPTGVDTVYAWTHAAGATDYTVNGTAVADLSALVAEDIVLAVPGATVEAPTGLELNADATLKNKWTAAAIQTGEDVEPGQQSATTYATQAEAEAALANVTIAASEAVTNVLDETAEAAYLAKFEKKVVEADGVYKIEVGLTAAATTALQTEVDADAAEVIEDLDSTTVTLTTTPGFYYSFEYGTTLDNMAEVGTRTLATGTTLTLDRPTTTGATAGFYKVLVNIVPSAPAAAQD